MERDGEGVEGCLQGGDSALQLQFIFSDVSAAARERM